MKLSHLPSSDKNALDRDDRRLLILAILGLFISGALLLDDRLTDWLSGRSDDNDRPKIGMILSSDRDVRHKGSHSLAWNKAHDKSVLRLGDGIFTGKDSRLKVELDRGGNIELGQNTLLLFTEIDGIEIPNLMNGNVSIAVNGKMKISFQGKLTELEGDGAVVSVQMEDGKPKIKLLRGAAHLKANGKKLALGKKSEEMKSESDLKIRERLLAPEGPSLVLHDLKLHEIYQQTEGRAFVRRPTPNILDETAPLSWSPQGNVRQTFLKHAMTPVGGKGERILKAGPNGVALNPLFANDNYWWVSLDEKNWQGPFHFQMVTQFATDLRAPLVQVPAAPITLFPGENFLPLNFATDDGYQGYLLETSAHPTFEGATKLQWLGAKENQIALGAPGISYWRVRGVDPKTRLSVFSPIVKVETTLPPLLSPPRLAGQKYRDFVNEPITVSWQDPDSAKSTQVTVINSEGKVIEHFAAQGNSWTWKSATPGRFLFKITATDAWGRKSSKSSVAQLLVDPKPDLTKLAVEKRAPSAETATLQMQVAKTPEYLNKDYRSSTFEILGAGFTMFSKEQTNAAQQAPIAYLVGLHAQHWFGGLGLEGFLKSKAGGVNAAAAPMSPQSTEVRGLYRTNFTWNPFSPLHEGQISAVVGYEMYKNSVSTLFSPGYNLVKAGFELNFPIFERWDTGGEVLSGVATDKSTKTEISGFLHYFLKKEVSLGAGYRVHFFEAGSTKSAPVTLPYREAFGEAFSSLRWHY